MRVVSSDWELDSFVFFVFLIWPQCDEALAGEEQAYLEEERNRILARVDDLKHRVSELERQLQETKQEVRHTHKQTHSTLAFMLSLIPL